MTQELADSMWRLNRARRMESQATTIDQLDKIAKYIATIERTYYRAYNELKRINAERNKSTGITYEPPTSKIQNEPKASLQFMLNEFRATRKQPMEPRPARERITDRDQK